MPGDVEASKSNLPSSRSDPKGDYATLAWEMRVFADTVRLQSFAKAAEFLGTSPSSVTRLVQQLEKKAGGPLIFRPPAPFQLTDLGETVRPLVLGALGFIDRFLDPRLEPAARGSKQITVRCPAVMRSTIELATAAKFRSLSPQIYVDFVGDTDPAGGSARADVILDFAITDEQGFATRHVDEERWIFVAARRSDGMKPEASELQNGDFLQVRDVGLSGKWEISRRRPVWQELVPRRINALDAELVLPVLEAGLATGIVPRWLAASALEAGRLVHVFPEWMVRPHSGNRFLFAHFDGALARHDRAVSRFTGFVQEWFVGVNKGKDPKGAAQTWRNELNQIKR